MDSFTFLFAIDIRKLLLESNLPKHQILSQNCIRPERRFAARFLRSSVLSVYSMPNTVLLCLANLARGKTSSRPVNPQRRGECNLAQCFNVSCESVEMWWFREEPAPFDDVDGRQSKCWFFDHSETLRSWCSGSWKADELTSVPPPSGARSTKASHPRDT